MLDLPSQTAQRVAAYRLGFKRMAASFGDPGADERLATDVADPLTCEPAERWARYLQGRTTFFDHVVVNALERDVTQVLTVGAGYDGRSLRYAKPGVRWFEVDHPATQADKCERLERLGIDASHVAFVGLDLVCGGLAARLLESGWEPDAGSVMLCEGVAVYLEAEVVQSLLGDLRTIGTVGTRLAMSISRPGSAPDQRERRERFESGVAALGEPARSYLGAVEVSTILGRTRWRSVELSDQAARAGLVVAAPVWQTALEGAPPSAGRVAGLMERMFHRRGVEGLAGHLEAAYGVAVSGTRELDLGVYRFSPGDGGDWIARVFPVARPMAAAQADAAVLRLLEQADFPAERCAREEPVTLYEEQAVLITEGVAGQKPAWNQATFRQFGDLLGRLHALPVSSGADGIGAGGAWHHLVSPGGPSEEVAAACALLEAAAPRAPEGRRAMYDELSDTVARAEDCDGLPDALIHPDFAPVNAIASPSGGPIVVDWTGAGVGPRLWSLAFLLWAAGGGKLACVDAVMSGYRGHVELSAAERDRLPAAIAARPVLFSAWSFCTGRAKLSEVSGKLPEVAARASRIARRALTALDPSS